jgi:hypothetical protein
MPFEMKKGMLYRMPVHFGPTPGPRQGPNGETFDWTGTPKKTAVNLSFLTDRAALDAILPAPLELVSDPVVTIEVAYMTELEWLAGRGYNTFGVRFPARFRGAADDVTGSFLAILWENLPDPILSGRDELGFNKLFCEIPPPRVLKGRHIYHTHWLGHEFFTMEVGSLVESSAAEVAKASAGIRNDGLLHYKYVPRTGHLSDGGLACVTHTPSTGSKAVIDCVWRGKGEHKFLASTWEQLPTMSHIVNALGALPVLEWRDAWLIQSHGGKDLGDQRELS